jgi:CubicO group peptidase (beta-lactamase class C family)
MPFTRVATIAAAMIGGCAPSPPAAPAEPASEARVVAEVVDPMIEAERARSGMPGAAFIFVRGGRVVYRRGYGVADVASAASVDPEQTVWPIASITKVVTAVAALQLVESRRLGLDDDINRRLRRLRVPAQGFPPVTLRQLLSHTAALDELPGRQFEGPARPDMADFLRTRLVRYRAPGLATAYSSYGLMLAGVAVEDASGQAYADYVARHIFRPLGMSRARVMLRRGDERGVATPYELEDGRADPVAHEYYVSTPASSVVASAADMGRLMIALLGGQRRGGSTILSPASLAAMTTQQATVHPALRGWGLGVQLDRVNGRDIAEHGGDIAGFSSLLVLLPAEDAGFFIVTHGQGNDLRFRIRQALLDRLWPAPPTAVPAPDPADAARLAEYGGRYLSSLACRTCPLDEDQVFTVAVAEDGTLRLWGQRWIPVARDLFVRDDGARSLGFSRHPDGRIASVTGGSWRVADRID